MTGDGSDDEDFTAATKKQKAPPAPAASSTSALATPATTAPVKKAAAAAAPARQGASLTGEDAVLEMIERLNAPVNAQMISDRFRGSLSKPCAEKHLLALHEAGLIEYKENGKAKIFWANQEHMDVPTEAELQQLDREIEDARAKRQQLDAKLKELQQAARAQKAKRTLGDVQRELVAAKAELEDAVELLEKDRAALGKQGTIAPLSQKEGEAVASEYSRYPSLPPSTPPYPPLPPPTPPYPPPYPPATPPQAFARVQEAQAAMSRIACECGRGVRTDRQAADGQVVARDR